jgi:hypothetical protein
MMIFLIIDTHKLQSLAGSSLAVLNVVQST